MENVVKVRAVKEAVTNTFEGVLHMRDKNFVDQMYFYMPISEVYLGDKKTDILYAKAFLDRNEKEANEYNQNTTTWD